MAFYSSAAAGTWLKRTLAAMAAIAVVLLQTPLALADGINADVKRYLTPDGPAEVKLDAQGNSARYSGEALTRGRDLFMENCAYCHANGLTLPLPPISLTLADLAGATPPRDNINGFVTYLREPMTYDGSEPSDWCRQVPESWLARPELEELAAFTLSAAEKVPGWGSVPSNR
ncbi:MAG: photosystem II cytochrome PsbV2 [Phormidium sp.]|nr:MAG: photosystem II cytochrome c550 PsbV2 [Phormidium sp. OSCR]